MGEQILVRIVGFVAEALEEFEEMEEPDVVKSSGCTLYGTALTIGPR